MTIVVPTRSRKSAAWPNFVVLNYPRNVADAVSCWCSVRVGLTSRSVLRTVLHDAHVLFHTYSVVHLLPLYAAEMLVLTDIREVPAVFAIVAN